MSGDSTKIPQFLLQSAMVGAAVSAAALLLGKEAHAPQPRADIKSDYPYAIYYGNPNNPKKTAEENAKLYEEIKTAVPNFKMIVVESTGYKPEQIAELKKLQEGKHKSSQILGYVSIGDMGDWESNHDKFVELSKTDAFTSIVKPPAGAQWGTVGHASMASKAWQDHLQEQIKKVEEKGCNGIFFDTLDTLTSAGPTPETVATLKDFFEKLHRDHPKMKIIVNRGFEWGHGFSLNTLDQIAPNIDGVLGESLDKGSYMAETAKQLGEAPDAFIVQKLQEFQKRHPNIALYSMDYFDPSLKDPKLKDGELTAEQQKCSEYLAKKRAEQGFIPGIAGSLMDIPVPPAVKAADLSDKHAQISGPHDNAQRLAQAVKHDLHKGGVNIIGAANVPDDYHETYRLGVQIANLSSGKNSHKIT